MKKILFLIFLVVVANIYAQRSALVSSFTIKEEINKADPIDPELGRYDAYELNVDKGDHIAFKLKGKNFQPFLLLVSPSKKSFLKVPSKKASEIVFDTVATERGNWEFYILSDTNSTGSYECTIAFATDEALQVPDSKDFCGIVKYLLLQSDGKFLFLRNLNVARMLFPNEDATVQISDEQIQIRLKKSSKFTDYVREVKKCVGEKYYSEQILNGIKYVENIFKQQHFLELRKGENGNLKIKIGRMK